MMYASASLEDGILYLRAGALDRAAQAFATAAVGSPDPAIRSESLRRQADIKRRRAQWSDALCLLREAVQIARAHALCNHVAAALNVEGVVHQQQGELGLAIQTYQAALAENPSPRQQGLICQNLGTAYAQQGALAAAAEWYACSAAAFEAAGCRREQVAALNNRGSIRLDQGELATAELIFREALHQAMALPLGDAELQALAEVNLAEVLARRGNCLEEAYDLLLRATGHFTASQDQAGRVACHRVFALVTEAQGFPELSRCALFRGLELARSIQSRADIEYFERELSRIGATTPQPVP